MKNKPVLPPVEKGVPIPDVARGDGRNVSKSPWPAYLERLVPGDSFVVEYPVVFNVTAIAKWMRIPLVKFDLPRVADHKPTARLWRLADEQVACDRCGSIRVRTMSDFCPCGGRLIARKP